MPAARAASGPASRCGNPRWPPRSRRSPGRGRASSTAAGSAGAGGACPGARRLPVDGRPHGGQAHLAGAGFGALPRPRGPCPPPPAEAFQVLLTLRILDGFDLARLERNGVDHLDLVWRAIRLAAGERIAHNKPKPEVLERLLSAGHVDRLRARAADGRPIEGPTEQWLPAPHDRAKEHTTSFSVADRFGNVICLTQSLGSVFGAGVVVPGTGVCLNKRPLLDRRRPAGDERPAARRRTGLSDGAEPRLRAGKPVLALGTPAATAYPRRRPRPWSSMWISGSTSSRPSRRRGPAARRARRRRRDADRRRRAGAACGQGA